MIHYKPDSATKYFTYRSLLNPSLSALNIYSTKDYIPDHRRIEFTRLRLMSHNLKAETGRWSGTPAELRLCSCDQGRVQNEAHVLLECPLSNECRRNFPLLRYSSVNNLLNDESHCDMLCKFVYNVLHSDGIIG